MLANRGLRTALLMALGVLDRSNRFLVSGVKSCNMLGRPEGKSLQALRYLHICEQLNEGLCIFKWY